MPDDPSSAGPWPRFRPSATAAILAPVVVSLLVQFPAAVWVAFRPAFADRFDRGPGSGPGPDGPADPAFAGLELIPGLLGIAFAVAGPLLLLLARRAPGPMVAGVAALALADLLLAPEQGPPYVALAFAIVLAVVRGAAAWAAASVAVAWVLAVALGSLAGLDWSPFRIAGTTAGLAVCFAIGWFWRTRRVRAAAYREEWARRRASAEERERVRIARELHDVIGHALSQITVQASVGLHLMDRDAEQARTALANIKDTSKSALDEVRSVLGIIREGEAPLIPQAELAELPRLVAGVRSATLDVALDDRLGGEAPGRAVQFAAYRIAQEALTNVVRHARATRARVVVERAGDEFRLVVDDDGRGLPRADAASAPADGAGILGMRERAALLGGTVVVGPGPAGGTRVEARMPWTT